MKEKIKTDNKTVFESSVTRQEKKDIIFAIVVPLILIGFILVTITLLGNYGRMVVTAWTSAMWILGLVAAFLLPSHRKKITNETQLWIFAYCSTLLIMKFAIVIQSGANSASISTASSVTMSETMGNNAMAFLQNAFAIMGWGFPLGFVTYQLQRVYKLKRNADKRKTLKQERHVRDTNKDYM